MSSGDTTRGSDYTVNALKKTSEIDPGAFLTRTEANEASSGKIAQGGETTASQKHQQLRGLILGTENPPLFLSLSDLRESL